MSILNVDDIVYEILNFLDIKMVIPLAVINKHIYFIIINTKIYKELAILQTYCPFYRDSPDIELLCKLNLQNVLQKALVVGRDREYMLDRIIIYASKYNKVNLLQYFTKHKIDNFKSAMMTALKNGNVSVLEWFYSHGYCFKYCKLAIREAMRKGKIDVIKWFHGMGYVFTYSKKCALHIAGKNKSCHDWFYNQDFIYVYTKNDIKFIIKCGHLALIEWFYESVYGFKISKIFVDVATRNNHIHILNWIKNKKFKFLYYSNAVETSCKGDNTKILTWYHNNGYIIEIRDGFIVYATLNGYIDVLEFLNSHEINYRCNYKNKFSRSKQFKFFIKTIDLNDILYMNDGYDKIIIEGFKNSLNWYKKSGFDIDNIKWLKSLKIENRKDRAFVSW